MSDSDPAAPVGVPFLTKRAVRRLTVELWLLWCCAAIVSAQAPVLEGRLKAAFVSKFAQFVEWPAAALAGRQTLDLCIAADDGAERDLNALVAGERVSGRPLVVRRITQDGDVDRCHLLFLPASDGSHAPLLRRASTRPIVTVGDEPAFLDDGGVIRLRAVDGRIRFDINARAAQRVGRGHVAPFTRDWRAPDSHGSTRRPSRGLQTSVLVVYAPVTGPHAPARE